MRIREVYIKNFKCFKGEFSLELSDGVNILVGNNETGKSTILEAIHLALSGVLYGRYLRNELSQYLFNNEVVEEYISGVKNGLNPELPEILIELYFDGNEAPKLEGDGNSRRLRDVPGVSFKIEFNEEDYNPAYIELLNTEFETIPIEFYKITWRSFARIAVTTRSIPIKSVLVDSSSYRYQNGSDIYISRIIRNNLDDKQNADISQAFRKLKETFMQEESVIAINSQVKKDSSISSTKDVEISVDLSTKNAWESILMTYLDKVPFHQIGKGEQCVVKTNLALSHEKSEEANMILLEEPENHLSHTKLNEFVNVIADNSEGKQLLISTHSSFVANKLGLDNLILLNVDEKDNRRRKYSFSSLNPDTHDYFKKLAGYDTLRLVLCKKTILVEGDSDELIVQKAYLDEIGKLPIENGIDVISVHSLAFKRFLDIARELEQPTAVVTDNDGNYATKITKKYKKYESVDCITIFADDREDLKTLEPQFVDANREQLDVLCDALGIGSTKYSTEAKILKYMKAKKNKTRWALSVFETEELVEYPDYIARVIEWCDEE